MRLHGHFRGIAMEQGVEEEFDFCRELGSWHGSSNLLCT